MKKISPRSALWYFCTFILAPTVSAQTYSFEGMGELPGQGGYFLMRLSGDGTKAVGSGWFPNASGANGNPQPGYSALEYTPAGGLRQLPLPDNVEGESIALNVNFDGTVISGSGNNVLGQQTQAIVWKPQEALIAPPYPQNPFPATSLMALTSHGEGGLALATDVSNQKFFLFETSGFTKSNLKPVASDAAPMRVQSISKNKKTAVGTVGNGLDLNAFRITASRGYEILFPLAGGHFETATAAKVSGDGTVIVGAVLKPGSPVWQAYRWSEQTGMVILPTLSGLEAGALAVSAQPLGTSYRVAGVLGTAANSEAVIWDDTHGLRGVEDVLVAQGVLAPGAWRLYSVIDLSDDGTVLIGSGFNFVKQRFESWRAVIVD